MIPNRKAGLLFRARLSRVAFLRWMGMSWLLCMGVAGCATSPTTHTVVPASPELIWSGPSEFSADYIWTTNRPAVGYDRPVKLVRLVVRQGRAVRAVGIDVFGATLYDLVIRTTPGGRTQTRFRQGAENIDALLLEQVARVMFLGEAASQRVRWQKQTAGVSGQPPASVLFQVESDSVELTLADASVAEQADADLDFQGAP